ncbi:MAG: HAD family hydrolase [Patescibacteria group bacterium]|nr:HAD family hydrolase [Patescibacteria group bacterium]
MGDLSNTGIIFDFDGVLNNSTRSGMNYHIEVAKKASLNPPTKKILKLLWGMKWEELLNELAIWFNWPEGGVNRFKAAYNENYESHRYLSFKDIKKILEQLRGIPMTIASSRDIKSMLQKMEEIGLNPEQFLCICSHSSSQFLKPDPRALEMAIDALLAKLVTRERIIFIGDTVNYDLAAAKNARLTFIGVSSGASTIKDFLAAGVSREYILSDRVDYPARLPKILAEMGKK